MLVIADLLKPISDENPYGSSIRYEPIFDSIRDARRQDQGGMVGAGEPKVADHRKAIQLSSEVIGKRSKDLQVAVWLTDSLIQRDGFAGLRDGLELILGLIENYWQGLYPEIEDGDVEVRCAPLDWLGGNLKLAKDSTPIISVQFVPITTSGLTWTQYQESRKPPSSEQKVTAEMFDGAVKATPKAFYKERAAELNSCFEILVTLDTACKRLFGNQLAPSFYQLRTMLEEIANTVSMLLQSKLKYDPDPVEEVKPEVNGLPPVDVSVPELPALSVSLPPPVSSEMVSDFTTPMPQSQNEAVDRIAVAALYLRRSAPANPGGYLLLRALRWGELRAQSTELTPSLLVAPSSEIRLKIKLLAAAEKWGELLDTTESVMATECARGWLDLQRYAVVACERLGHAAVARAIKSELRCLLIDYPALANATLLDDTGAANPETMAWLVEHLKVG